jgi:hypothetical protein
VPSRADHAIPGGHGAVLVEQTRLGRPEQVKDVHPPSGRQQRTRDVVVMRLD